MSKRQSRRQWLLGLVGAVFGAGAARAVDRFLPETKAFEPAILTLTVQHEKGVADSLSRPAQGRVVVEHDPQTGVLRVTEYDEHGNRVRSPGGLIRSATLSLPRAEVVPVPAVGGTVTEPFSGVAVTYTYDSLQGLSLVSEPVVTFTYDAGRSGATA